MSYSTAFSQAMAILLFIADKVRQGTYDYVPTRAIADALEIPRPTAVKILGNLTRAGIIQAREGAKGGVRLATDAKRVNALAVFDAIEQQRPLFQHDVRFRVRGTKPTRAQKEIRSLLGDCEQAMKKVLARTNLGELVDQLNK